MVGSSSSINTIWVNNSVTSHKEGNDGI